MRLAALASVLVLFAGCFHADDVAPATAANVSNATTGPSFLPPPDIVTQETNKTVAGTGGKPHYHDYWSGRSRVPILQTDVVVDLFPVFPGGQDDTSRAFSAVVGLPSGVLVYEGTGQVEILATDFAATLTGLKVAPKTAMDYEFGEAIPLTDGTPLVLDIEPEQADMPHATNSLWEFRFLADGTSPLFFDGPSRTNPSSIKAFNLSLTVVKARDVANWPGHPDFYGGKAARVVLDKAGTTKQVGLDTRFLYGEDANNIQAERLISMGTHHLYVFVNITSAASPVGAPEGYFLEYRNATGNWRRVFDEANETTSHQSYRVPVTSEGLDSPYAPQSRWQFRILAVFKEIPSVAGLTPRNGLCPGCFAYDLGYNIRVLAYPTADPEAGATG